MLSCKREILCILSKFENISSKESETIEVSSLSPGLIRINLVEKGHSLGFIKVPLTTPLN